MASRPGRPEGAQQDWRARLRGSKLGTALVLLVTLALVLGGWWLVDRPSGGDDPTGATSVELSGDQSGQGPVVGQPAPGFTATGLDGKTVSLAALKGKPVWLNFGATWCTACRAEAPDMQAVYAKSHQAHGTQLVAVYLSEPNADIEAYATRLGLDFTHVPDPQTVIASQYRTIGIPVHFFIDAQGVLRKTVVGGMTEDSMTKALAEIGG